MVDERLVIVLSGTPGTGKTTIALELKKLYSAFVINLTDFAINNDLILEYDAQRQTKIVDIDDLVPKLEESIKAQKGNIIVEGHFADIVPESLTSIFLILRTNPHILEKRLKKKQFNKLKIQENLQSEILGVCTSAALEAHTRSKIYEIDTSTLSVNKTLQQIQNLIQQQPPTNLGKVNWMRQLEESNELIKFF
jgi:adenylate kinase